MDGRARSHLEVWLLLAVLVCCLIVKGCGDGDGNGTCTILGVGIVIQDISLEECQDVFLDTPGATGFRWEP